MDGQNPELTEEIVKLLGAELITLKKQIIVLKEDNSALLTRAQSAEGELSLLKSQDPEDVKSNSQTQRTKLEGNDSEGDAHLTHSLSCTILPTEVANEERQQVTFRDLVSERDTKITENNRLLECEEGLKSQQGTAISEESHQIMRDKSGSYKVRKETIETLEAWNRELRRGHHIPAGELDKEGRRTGGMPTLGTGN